MREILFRGKNELTNEWEYGSLHIQSGEVNENDNQELEYRILGLRGQIDYVFPETVGQFTGLYDSTKWEDLSTEEQAEFLYPTNGGKRKKEDWKGKPIFEGDICRFREWNKGGMCWVGKVHYEHQQFVISGNPNKECESEFLLVMSRFIPESIEVIGNIHDNPELLGGGEK